MVKPFFFFSGTDGPVAMGLGMKHLGHEPIIIYTHDNPGLILMYFIARSKLGSYAFVSKKVNLDFQEVS